MPSEKALLGFTGAPFTLASYLIEGAGSRDYVLTKSFLASEPVAFARLFELQAQSGGTCISVD